MGIKFIAYTPCPLHPVTTQIICQYRELLIWNGEGLVFGIRCGLLLDKYTQADSSQISLVQVDLEQIKYII